MGQNTVGQNTTPSPPQSYYPGHASPQTPPSSNQSPTSYHAHLHVRQLRPQKQPLYTPACLRPTEDFDQTPRPCGQSTPEGDWVVDLTGEDSGDRLLAQLEE